MEEPVKIFHGVWPCGDEVIHGCFYKLGIGRLKGFVTTTATFIFFFFLVVVVALFWMDIPIIRGDPFSFTSKVHHERFQFPLTCSTSVNISSAFNPKDSPTKTCPDYFRWIHQDLKQFKTSGITKDLIESGTPSADFRLVIVDGNAYVDRYRPSYQTRDLFTIWGILQLLKLYPGKVKRNADTLSLQLIGETITLTRHRP
ncbi:uncharacterized protein LOC120132865 [Hibiscus syriacus]|uniref:uncharacterized protein LOC120132865 n=1 Tax=Hibiscus syriacus TaxID=106335 RepID=UPI001924EA36|nr:uncharacterized protein LOC120132865 [Hibiscus syriacus]